MFHGLSMCNFDGENFSFLNTKPHTFLNMAQVNRKVLIFHKFEFSVKIEVYIGIFGIILSYSQSRKIYFLLTSQLNNYSLC